MSRRVISSTVDILSFFILYYYFFFQSENVTIQQIFLVTKSFGIKILNQLSWKSPFQPRSVVWNTIVEEWRTEFGSHPREIWIWDCSIRTACYAGRGDVNWPTFTGVAFVDLLLVPNCEQPGFAFLSAGILVGCIYTPFLKPKI